MAQAAVNDVFQVTINGTLHSNRTMTTFYYRILQVAVGSTVSVVAQFIRDRFADPAAMNEKYRFVCPSNWTYSQLWVQRILPTRTIKDVFNVNLPGLSTNPSTVSNVSASIKRQAEQADRHAIGGVRLPLSPADCVNGGLAATPLINLQTLATQMKAPLSDANNLLDAGFIKTIRDAQGNIVSQTFQVLHTTEAQFTSRVVRRRTVGLGI